MKKTLLITAMFIGSFVSSYAQPGPPPPPKAPRGEHGPRKDGDKKEKLESMKIGYLTRELDLTPEEAQKFWPVYNEFSNKEHELRKAKRSKMKESGKSLDELSDKEVEALVDEEMVFRQKELDLQKEYHKQFKTILPPRKVAKLYRAEEKFKRELVKKIQEKKSR